MTGSHPSSSRVALFRVFIRRWFNWLVLGAMAGAILGAVLLLLSTGAAERAERNQVERLGDVLLMLDRIERAALSAESAQRGYYITLDTRYLKPYRTSRRDAETAMERLARSIDTRMTDEQRAEFVAIEDALNDKFAELDQTIGQVKRGQLRDARRQILEGEGYDAMQRLTAAIDRLAQIENRLLLLLLVSAIVLGAVLVARTAQAETEAAQARELEVARDRANLLAQELNHRVKNLFAMVLAIIQMSAREASDVTAYKDRISARIHALLTAHEVTQGHGTAADRLNRQGGASLRALVEATVEPHVSQDKRLVLEGEDVAIDRVQVTPLGLVLHELATNAVKYGCWRDAGELAVRWTRKGNLLHLDWQEDWDTADQKEGEQPAQSQGGFGSTLMIGAARQLGGEIERTFGPRGVTVSIAFPAQPGTAAA